MSVYVSTMPYNEISKAHRSHFDGILLRLFKASYCCSLSEDKKGVNFVNERLERFSE